MTRSQAGTRLAAAVGVTLGLACQALPVAAEQLVDDHSPWWLWADRWQGTLSYDEKMIAPKALDSSTRVRSQLVFEKRTANGCTVTWNGSEANSATIDSHTRGGFTEQNDVTKLGGQSSDSMRGRFSLSPDSSLEISLEQQEYAINLAAADDATVMSRSRTSSMVQMRGSAPMAVHQDNSGQDPVEFQKSVTALIPPNRGPLTRTLNEDRDPGGGATHTERTSWSLEPEHDLRRWADDYAAILEAQRKSRREYWESVQKKCSDSTPKADRWSGQPCRTADAGIRSLDDRVARLQNDCVRILDKLVNRQCPGFAKGMEVAGKSWVYDHAACTGPAQTCELVHRLVFDYFDSKATGDLETTRRRLPQHLQCLYPSEKEFEPIATTGALGFWDKALGH